MFAPFRIRKSTNSTLLWNAAEISGVEPAWLVPSYIQCAYDGGNQFFKKVEIIHASCCCPGFDDDGMMDDNMKSKKKLKS